MVAISLPAPSGIAAGSSQRRLKKLGFKQLLSIQRGSSGNGLSLLGATESSIENEDQQDRGLGVDASEVTEHHLQAALSSTQLASDATNGTKGQGSLRPAYHIPTPEAKAVLTQNEYSTLYPSGAYSDPVTYVRSSETVEQSCQGPAYCMDEDDNDWLEERNKKAEQAIAAALKNVKSPLSSMKGKGKERTKEEMMANLAKDDANLKVISCEEYEMIITVFEQVTAEKVPFAHLDLSKLPGWESLLPSFENNSTIAELALPELPELPWEHHHSSSSSSKNGNANGHYSSSSSSSSRDQVEWSPLNPYRNLSALKHVARVVYPFWKERREEKEGKALVPILNFDESNENDPYVCFRRREVKTIRKTRKTDVLHLEKLVKLRNEMQQAVTLLALLAHREKTKRASLMQDRACWQITKDFLDVKRVWNIQGTNAGQEDEDLVSGEKREDQLHGVAGASKRKRKVEDGAAGAAAAAAAAGSTLVKVSTKKPRPSGEDSGTAAQQSTTAVNGNNGNSTSSIGLGSAISDRVQAVQAYIERECQRKADGDVGWEEGSDAAFQPMLVPSHLRNFRPIHSESDQYHNSSSSNNNNNNTSISWSNDSPSNATSSSSSTSLSLPRVGRPASFRRRMGRGGRIFLDRRLPAPSPVPASLSDWPRPDPNHDQQMYRRQRRQEDRQQNVSQEQVEAKRERLWEMEKRTKPWEVIQQTPLTGPFAFSPSIRPSLLNSVSPMIHVHASQGVLQSDQSQVAEGASSDASSPVSSSTQLSKDSSNATTMARATSTQPTDLGETEDGVLEGGMMTKSFDGMERVENDDGDGEDDGGESDTDDDLEKDTFSNEDEWQEAQERWSRLQERWRYDEEGGRWAGLGLCGLGGMEDDDEAIVDDFDQRFMRFRMTLLEEADLMKLSTDLTNVMQAQAAADAPPLQPVGYAIFRGENPSMFHQQQTQQQQQQAVQQAQRQQAQAQAIAVAAANVVSSSNGAGGLNAHLQGQAGMAMSNDLIARAAQTNVGGPLTALQQQQQIHQAQLQMALHQQQQRAAAAAQAQQAPITSSAAASASSQQQQQQQQQQNQLMGGSGGSPIPRPRSGQQMNMPHPLAQSFSSSGPTSSSQNMNSSPNAMNMGSSNNNGRFQGGNGATNGLSSSTFAGSGINGMTGSPQLQAHLAASRNATTSLSPQQRSSPHIAPAVNSFQSSPAQNHVTPMNQGVSQQQRMLSQAGSNGNAFANNAAPQPQQQQQLNPLAAAAAIQQAQANLQAQQQQQQQQQQQGGGGGGVNGQTQNQFSNQLLAMHAALTQNNQSQSGNQQLPMQLRLPANRSRALEMAQQAAKLAAAAQQGGLQQTSSATPPPNSSQAQIGMGILSNLQQQMNFTQNQQHNFLNSSAAASNKSNSPQAKSRS
ncbi:hypothetical protein CBS101457_006600 [Exobasidium rhododendri]|nr:hypothetical protein CBS101457_006600 [Exobasidium rhododendri]